MGIIKPECDKKAGVLFVGKWFKCKQGLIYKAEDVGMMCNLGTGIEERVTEKIILNMYKKGYTLNQIADVAETGVETVEAIIKKKEPVMQ